MKKINEETLLELEKYSGLMFSIPDIADILELDEQELKIILLERGEPGRKAFKRGRLLMEAKIRQSIFDLASNGSSPAQAFAVKLIDNAKMEDL